MLDQKIEAVFVKGVFLPLQPVDLPEDQRVTLVLPSQNEALEEEIGYVPHPFDERKTIRVKFKFVGNFGQI